MSRDQSTTKALALGEKQQHLLPTLTESVVDGALRLWHDNLRSARTQENYGRTIGRFRQYLRDLGHDLDGDRRAVALAAEKFARAKQRADGTIVAGTVGPSGFNARLAALSSLGCGKDSRQMGQSNLIDESSSGQRSSSCARRYRSRTACVSADASALGLCYPDQSRAKGSLHSAIMAGRDSPPDEPEGSAPRACWAAT